jgi:hypothetical protein
VTGNSSANANSGSTVGAASNGLLATATPSATAAALNSTNLALMGLMNGGQSSTGNAMPNGFAAAQQLYAAWAAYAALANGGGNHGNSANTTAEQMMNGSMGNISGNSSIGTNESVPVNTIACDSSISNNSMIGLGLNVDTSKRLFSTSIPTSSNNRSACSNLFAGKSNEQSSNDSKSDVNRLFNTFKKGTCLEPVHLIFFA